MVAHPSPSRDCKQFYVPVDSPEWRVLKTHCVLHLPTPPVFFYDSTWLFEGSFRHLFYTIAQSKLAFSAAVQLLRVATDALVGYFSLDDCVHPGEPLLAALRPLVISFIDFMDIGEMALD